MQLIKPKEFCRFGKQIYDCKTIITKKIGKRTLSGTSELICSYKLRDAGPNPEKTKELYNAGKQTALKTSIKKARAKILLQIEKLATKKYGSPKLRNSARNARIKEAEEKTINTKNIKTIADSVKSKVQEALPAGKDISPAIEIQQVTQSILPIAEEVSTTQTKVPLKVKKNKHAATKVPKEKKTDNPFNMNVSKLAELGNGFADSITPEIVNNLAKKMATSYKNGKTILTAEKENKHLFPVFVSIYERKILGVKQKKPYKSIGKGIVRSANPIYSEPLAKETFIFTNGNNIIREEKNLPPITGRINIRAIDKNSNSTQYREEEFIEALAESRKNAREEMRSWVKQLANKKYGNAEKRNNARNIRRNKNTLNKFV